MSTHRTVPCATEPSPVPLHQPAGQVIVVGSGGVGSGIRNRCQITEEGPSLTLAAETAERSLPEWVRQDGRGNRTVSCAIVSTHRTVPCARSQITEEGPSLTPAAETAERSLPEWVRQDGGGNRTVSCAIVSTRRTVPCARAIPAGVGSSGWRNRFLCYRVNTQNRPLCYIGQKKAIIAVSRKLLKMIYILLEKGQYYDPNYAVKASE